MHKITFLGFEISMSFFMSSWLLLCSCAASSIGSQSRRVVTELLELPALILLLVKTHLLVLDSLDVRH